MFCFGERGCSKIIALCKQCNTTTFVCKNHSSIHFIETKHNQYETNESIIIDMINTMVIEKIEVYTNEIIKKEDSMISHIKELSISAIRSLENAGKSLANLSYFELMSSKPNFLSGIVDDLEFIFKDMKNTSVKNQELVSSEVTFEVYCPTRPGEIVLLSGSCPELGSWKIEKAVGMNWFQDNIWKKRIKLNSKNIAFKYIIQTPYEIKWEQGWNRTLNIDYSKKIDKFRGLPAILPIKTEEETKS